MRTKIIAEIGINHNGDMNMAKMLIHECGCIGVDYIKFQLYDPRTLLNESDFDPLDWKMILAAELTRFQFQDFVMWGVGYAIPVIASAFDLERLGWLEAEGVPIHKIASRSVYDREYVDAVFRTGRPVLISSGWFHRHGEFGIKSHDLYKSLSIDGPMTKLLLCVSEYPAPLRKYLYSFKKMLCGEIQTDLFQGVSDHTGDPVVAQLAIHHGMEYVEVHFTMDKSLPGPDHRCSLTIDDLRMICKFRNEVAKL